MANSAFSSGGGILIQRVSTATGAYATGTTLLPFDDTIPQNTEGDQYMSLAITPQSASNILVIYVFMEYDSSTNSNPSMALFQDSTAGALTAGGAPAVGAGIMCAATMTWVMAAGTTSATTFKVRAGIPTSGSFYFNGASGARIYGGVSNSGIMITEYTV